jgi:hypothetical protein
MTCKCKHLLSAEILGELLEGRIVLRHSVCGEPFGRVSGICRCDTISPPKEGPGNPHFLGCCMYDAWVYSRVEQVRFRLDAAAESVIVKGPGGLFANTNIPAAGSPVVKYLGTTKRGIRFNVGQSKPKRKRAGAKP